MRKPLNGNSLYRIFSLYEGYFSFGGYVNKHNCRIWGNEYPQTTIEKPLHTKSHCIVWHLVWKGNMSVLYWKLRDRNTNGQFWFSFFYFLAWNENVWFQKNHVTSDTIGLHLTWFCEIFPGCVIWRFPDVNWPPTSRFPTMGLRKGRIEFM